MSDVLPTNRDFREYMVLDGLFTDRDIPLINGLWNDAQKRRAEVSGPTPRRDDVRMGTVVPVEPSESTRWLFQKLTLAIQAGNMQSFHFEILDVREPLQLIEYGVGDFFDWHLDFSAGASSNRKVSATVQLSDPDDYEGGDLEFMINRNRVKAPRDLGTVIVFPSFILHRVTPVTRGVRRSIVGWIAGSPFR